MSLNDTAFSNSTPKYPEKRFITMLVFIGMLIVLVGYTQRLDTLSSKGDSFSQLALQADIEIKICYASERWSKFRSVASADDTADFLKRRALNTYREAVRELPIPRNIRRYIIVMHDTNTRGIEKAIQLLEESAARPEYSGYRQKQLLAEANMWRSIYTKPGVPRSDVPIFEKRIRSLHLGWYSYLALRDLYKQAGLSKKADGQQIAALNSAAVITILLFGIILCALFAVFAGLIILASYVNRKIVSRSLRASTNIEIPADASIIAGYLLEVFVVYLITLLISQGIGGILLGAADFILEGISPTFAIIVTVGSYILGGLVALAYLSFRLSLAGWSLRSIGLRVDNFGRNVLWGVSGYFAAFPLVLVAGLISQVLGKYIRTPENPVLPLFLQADTIFAKTLLFILVGVAAPFFEEIFFRGVLFTSLRARWGVNAAVVISAAIFASIHPLPVQFLPIFVLGAAFATLMYERGSLVSSMVAHSLQNSGVFLLLLIGVG